MKRILNTILNENEVYPIFTQSFVCTNVDLGLGLRAAVKRYTHASWSQKRAGKVNGKLFYPLLKFYK